MKRKVCFQQARPSEIGDNFVLDFELKRAGLPSRLLGLGSNLLVAEWEIQVKFGILETKFDKTSHA